tara:strand:- start:462 stop:656 length:195 start_codon:yes stop_codon:yes gene_type:complete
LKSHLWIDESTKLAGESSNRNDGEDSGSGVGVGGKDEEFVDDDGVMIGVRYIKNVLQKMLEITV